MLLLNIRGFLSHKAELDGTLALLHQPLLVGLTETWLDASVGEPSLSGYSRVSRLDRRDGRIGGGLLMFARQDVACWISHVADSSTHERSWHILYTDVGPLLIALWYRPPDSGMESIRDLEAEAVAHQLDTIGTMVLGDMNIHHASWRRHSSSTSAAGRELFEVCGRMGLAQHVRRPTRGDYLLDLVLSDLSTCVSSEVLAGISDHNMVCSSQWMPLNLRLESTGFSHEPSAKG